MNISRNVFNLFVWQGSTYIAPLLVTPYLTRTLGLESYGIFGLTLAIISYGLALSDWGFALSATQKVARASNNEQLLRELFWSTLLAKMFLSLLSFAILCLFLLFIPDLLPIWKPLLAGCIAIIATALSANWFLQGLQFMGAFATSALIGRFLMIPLTFYFVRSQEDLVLAIAIQGATQLVSAIVSLVVSARLVTLTPFEFKGSRIWHQIRDGWLQFLSGMAVILYTQFNAIFVGFMAGPAQAGLLTGSLRVLQAFQGLINPITMAIYPVVNQLTETDMTKATSVMLRALAVQGAFTALLSAIMFFVSPYVIVWYLGSQFVGAVPVIRMISLMPFLAGVTNILGSNMMLPLGLKVSYTVSLLMAGVINTGLLFVLAPGYGAFGGAIAITITEVLLTAMMAGCLYFKWNVTIDNFSRRSRA